MTQISSQYDFGAFRRRMTQQQSETMHKYATANSGKYMEKSPRTALTFVFLFLSSGALTSMPAVRAFALYAGVAIVFNFLLQIFAFVALLTLDARRHAVSNDSSADPYNLSSDLLNMSVCFAFVHVVADNDWLLSVS